MSLSHLSLAEHAAEEGSDDAPALEEKRPTRRSRRSGRPEGDSKAKALRASLIKCAEQLDVLQPSKDYTDFIVDGKTGFPYVVLYHATGEYKIPLDGTKLKEGSYQALVSFPKEPKRKEKLLLTISMPKGGNLDQISVRTTIAPKGQNPNKLDEINAVSTLSDEKHEKDRADESFLLNKRFARFLGADLEDRVKLLMMRVPEIENIFAGPLKAARDKAIAELTGETDEAAFGEALGKKLLEAVKSVDLEGEFRKQTEIAMNNLTKSMMKDGAKLMLGMKACSKTLHPTLNKFTESQQDLMLEAIQAQENLKLIFPTFIKSQLEKPFMGGKRLNAMKIETLDPTFLTEIHDAIAVNIRQMYSTQHELFMAGLELRKREAQRAREALDAQVIRNPSVQ